MLSAITKSCIRLSVIMLSAVMLSVVAPYKLRFGNVFFKSDLKKDPKFYHFLKGSWKTILNIFFRQKFCRKS
jgi:hypothetical protein